ncbi:MAG: LysM peptidoglycan-binding domain-containing protein [Desulfotomaculaceae bacterium]|nr:LysM peptidoglycan-binding domain-containing protein [Desulfotomaculaceae bacterium]
MSLVTRVFLSFFVFVCALIAPLAAHAATHNVSPGESLFTISRNYGISLNSLMEANGIWDSMIYPGQQLYIPQNGASGGSSYTVRAGDSLFLIGQKFGVSYQEIMSANGLQSSYIYPGMSLYIPTTTPGTTAQPPAQVSRGGFQRPTLADVDILARLITAEAEGEPYEGKVAVGAVVLNRIDSPEFPNSIPEVIYQYEKGIYQFEPVMNGWINRAASPESVKAAKEALGGKDPTNGAIYFFATYVKNSWLWSRPLSRIIGNHVFTY